MKVQCILLCLFCWISSEGQSDLIDYQSVLTDNQNNILRNISVDLRVNIIEGTSNGTEVYTETHQVLTGPNGEITLEIGGGSPVNSSFNDISWETPHYIKLGYRPESASVFLDNGTIEMFSVPYAIFATKLTCELGCPGEKGPEGRPCWDIDADGLADPSEDTNGDGEFTIEDCFGRDGQNGRDGIDGQDGAQGRSGTNGLNGNNTLDITSDTPQNPQEGEFYLDDGSNRTDATVGLRYFDGTQWIDL